MVDYKALGYSSLEEYLKEFNNSLLETAHSYEYFVDWEKVESKTKDHIVELGLLNSLTLISENVDRKRLLRKLLSEHPKLMGVIPIFLAVREQSLEVANLVEQIIYKRFDFTTHHVSKAELDDMIVFCEKTGFLELFGKIKDAYTYVIGVEVGLDSNARKNRSGTVFNDLIEDVISSTKDRLIEYGISYKTEVELANEGLSFSGQKKVDFMIYQHDKPLAACEVNIYHTSGSKPSEIIRSYIGLNQKLKEAGTNFLWFTDGPGWLVMKKQLKAGINAIDYVLNYSIATKNLEKLISHLIR